MKNLIFAALLLITTGIIFSCQKTVTEPQTTSDQHHRFGAEGNVNQDYIKFRRGGVKGKPPKFPTDTTVTPTPTDTVPAPTPTPTPDPVPTLPSAYSIPMQTPLQQGSEGSCVSFSVAYTREREEFNKTGVWTMLSEEYLFNQTTSDHNSCSGSAIITALNFLLTNGICTWASMPYMWTNGCSTMPTAAQTSEAAKYRISDYVQIWVTDTILLKQALLANHPLVIQIPIDQNLYNAKAGFVWTQLGPILGYHSVALCGYDDTKRAFKFINSWGVAWGDGGFGWVSYDLFPKVSSSAMKMIL